MRDYIKYTGVLFIITLVTALLLGVVNNYTAPVIETNTAEKEKLAIEAVVEGKIDTETAISHNADGMGSVIEITEYKNDSDKSVFAVKSVTNGYGGDIEMMVGINSEGLVSGVEIINMSETPGLGAKAKDDEDWISQFLGKGPEKLVSITGATITSKAVELGVKDAVTAVEKIIGGGVN